jgi:hypothetical protein
MADRKSDVIRNKAYETLIICKSVMTKCVSVECIQLLQRMIARCNRPNVKERAVTILCEISHSNSKLITFDIYDMLRSYKVPTSDMSLSHAIEITLQEIRQHCVHLHSQIDEYETSMLTSCHNNNHNENMTYDCGDNTLFLGCDNIHPMERVHNHNRTDNNNETKQATNYEEKRETLGRTQYSQHCGSEDGSSCSDSNSDEDEEHNRYDDSDADTSSSDVSADMRLIHSSISSSSSDGSGSSSD